MNGQFGVCAVLALLCARTSLASDHADPIDPLRRQRQEGAITDLYVFPVLSNDRPAFPFERPSALPIHDPHADVIRSLLTPDQLEQIDALVFILCVRRNLKDASTLRLRPYVYEIHIDVDNDFKVPTSQTANSASHSDKRAQLMPQERPTIVEAYARYGGKIDAPESIQEDITIQFRLTDEGKLQEGYPKYEKPLAAAWATDDRIQVAAGIYEDPFIFPGFFGANVVAMAVRVPKDLIPRNRSKFLIWAESWKGRRQIDHCGRALRTQNPRFDQLNSLHPSRHVASLVSEHERPGLMRDILLRLNLASLFAYRAWDFEPDVMCLSLNQPVGFPNGRLLTDDVVAILAQHGETLLFDLSYQHDNSRWPRQTTNDRRFKRTFPFLGSPFTNPSDPVLHAISPSNVLKLVAIGVGAVLLFVAENWLVARLYYLWKDRRKYL